MLILAHAHIGHYFPKVWTRSNNHGIKKNLQCFYISYPLNNGYKQLQHYKQTNPFYQNYQKIICLYTSIELSIIKYLRTFRLVVEGVTAYANAYGQTLCFDWSLYPCSQSISLYLFQVPPRAIMKKLKVLSHT